MDQCKLSKAADIKLKASSSSHHCFPFLSPHSCSPVLWSDWLLWEVTVYQTLGNSIIRTLYWDYNKSTLTAPIHNPIKSKNTQIYLYADTPTKLPQVNGMHGCTRSRQTERRDTQMDAHTCQMLSLFHLLSINQILAYLGNLVPGSGAECPTSPLQTTSLPTHCVNLHDIINMHHSPEQDQALCLSRLWWICGTKTHSTHVQSTVPQAVYAPWLLDDYDGFKRSSADLIFGIKSGCLLTQLNCHLVSVWVMDK